MLLLGFQGNMQQSNKSERHGKCSASKGVLGSAPGLQEMYCSLKQSEKPLEIKTEKIFLTTFIFSLDTLCRNMLLFVTIIQASSTDKNKELSL